MTDAMRHRLLGAWIFCVMWLVIPVDIWFYHWLMFVMTTIFWFVIALLISTLLLAFLYDRFEDD